MSFNIFLSYSTKDLQHANDLQAELAETPVNLYVADRSLPVGSEIRATLIEQIKNCSLFVLIWSDRSKDSEWILWEVGQATALNKQIIPIALDEAHQIPASLAHLKFLTLSSETPAPLREVKSRLLSEYGKYATTQAAKAQRQKEKDDLAKLAFFAFVGWLALK